MRSRRRVMMLVLAVALLLATALPVGAQGGPRTYQVRSGDTWTGVSYRLGVNMCALATANGHRRCSGIYRSSSALMVGQTLEVPSE